MSIARSFGETVFMNKMDEVFMHLDDHGGRLVWSSRYKRVSLFGIEHKGPDNKFIGHGSRFLTLHVENSIYTVTLHDIVSSSDVKDPDCYEASIKYDPKHFYAYLSVQLKPTRLDDMEIRMCEHEYHRGLLQASTDILPVNDGMSYQGISIQSVDELLAMLRGLSARKQYVQP